MSRPARKQGNPPDDASLREAALRHLSRFATTEAGLARVLERRIERWGRAAEADGMAPERVAAAVRAARRAVPGVVAFMRECGAVNDPEFVASRARRLTRSGKSRRATVAHLVGKGIAPDIATDLLPEDADRDLAAACAYLRRRRLPPFAPGDRLRALGALARGGFGRDVAERALDLDEREAELLVSRLRAE